MEELKIVKVPVFRPFRADRIVDSASWERDAIAIFDSRVEHYEQLVAGLHADITPYILSPDEDGIRQLTTIFRQHTQPLTVHLVSHGSPGTLYVGSTELSLATLQRHTEVLETWFQPDSEWLLYGCNVAAGDAGEEFLAKLRQITGATLAASTHRIGNAQRGGSWRLDKVLGEMAIALPFSASVAHQYPGVLITPIDSIIAQSETSPPLGTTYTAPEVEDGDGDGSDDIYTYTFQSGTENDLVISGITAAGSEFSIVQVVDIVNLERVDNAAVTGEREIFWYEIDSIDTANNDLQLNPSFVGTLQEALTSQTVNRGADNLFANEGSANVNNIERVDFVITDGIAVTADLLDDVGFLLLERGGNDSLIVAPITAIDAAGNPTAYGDPVPIDAADWGGSGIDINSAVLNDQGSGDPSLSALPGSQELSGIFLSFESLGVTGSQTFFGYSVFPADVGSDLVGLSDANLSTSQASGEGGLDLVTGSAVFSRALIGNTPPALNLDPSNVTGGVDDRNFDTTFTIGGGAVEITADDATAVDPDNSGVDIETLTITVNTPDGANEILSFGGTPVALTNGASATLTFGTTDFDIAVTAGAGNATVTITNEAGGDVSNVDLRTLLRSLSYNNTSAAPDTTDRVFSFTANDGLVNSNTVTSTVSFNAAGNTSPILNLDPTNVTGGLDDRNFDTTFTVGGSAVEITADDATAIDPDNSGVDIETLTITVNTPDGANEVLSFAGTPLTLTNGTTETLTFGATTFDIAVTSGAGSATVTITNEAGGDISNVDLRTLLRSLTYDNTSAAPDTTDRVFSFTANDGLANSNTVTSTVSFNAAGNTPPILNLDPINASGGLDDRNFDTTFAVGGNAVEITADDATAVDPDNSGVDIETLTITVNTPDGANEVLSFAGTPLTLTNGTTETLTFGGTDFDIAVTSGTGSATVTVTNDAGGAMDNVDLRTLLRSLTYDNTSANPNTTDRVFSFVAQDGAANSNTVTSTVNFATTANTPPILNLDPNNVTGGVDNRNFEAIFIAGEDAVDIAADDATAIDPNNGGEDIETLAIAVNIPDGANEVLNFGGTALTLTDGAATTVTFGSTTFEVSVGVAAGTATIDVASTTGGDIPNPDLRRLLRSLSYDNTAASPTVEDRIFTFVANDGVVNSNLVTSTITVQPRTVSPNPPRDCSGGLRLAGNAGNNRLVGGGRTDIIRGFAGRDEMLGLACPDRLLGGAGNDSLFGGAASDTLDGGAGRDRLSGQNGDDTLFGRGGTDRLNGGKGDDQLNGQSDRDYLRGKAGFDQLRGGQGDDGIAGGAGGDRLFGGAGRDQMFGGGGRDRIRGNAQADRIFGGTGNDIIFGQNGNDVLRGAAGRDILQGNAGSDQILGGDGSDRLFGGALDDRLNGGAGADRLSGQRGNDILRGGRQRDRLNGGAGNDRLSGGTGADRLLGQGGRDALRGNSGADVMIGGAGQDQAFGGRGNDEADGGAQGDFLRGNTGADVLFGKAGDDLLSGNRGFDRLNGGDGNDTLLGGGAADQLIGRSGRDRLEGLAGNDQLEGNNGRDTLIGGTGSDVLIGRADGDQLQGGRGADRFVFAGATLAEALRDSLITDPDEIVDFNQAEGDRFSINFTTGSSAATPSALFNVGTVVASNLQDAATLAFRDRNPNRPGNQRTAARQALLFDWRGSTYLLVNNTNRSFNAAQDLLADVTGIGLKAGDANRVSLSVNDYFV
ncbi:MAG: DUF4347 domain-containing protein [Cyanobacteria bacterium J06638_22]